MSEIPCDCCNTEGDHPSRIICDACFQSAKGKAQCCIDTQAENKRLKAKIDLVLLELAHIEGEKTPTEIRIEHILQEKPK